MITALRLTGDIYRKLGQLPQALDFQQQALTTAQNIGARPQAAQVLAKIASIYQAQGKFDQALQRYQQGLTIAQAIGDLDQEAKLLSGIGSLYLQQSQPAKALASLQQALTIQQRIGTRRDAAETLTSIGQAQTQLGAFAEAQNALQQAMVSAEDIGDRPTQAQAFANLGRMFTKQQKPALAIAFYKQSVNTYEGIRIGIRSLSKEQQDSYTQTITGTYRALADLLIARGRLGEAQQVMELLKVQELNDLTPTRTSVTRLAELALNPTEQEIQKQYTNLIAFGARVRDCKQDCSALKAQRQKLIEQTVTDGTLVRIDERNKDFIASASKIVNAQPNTVLIYPLVLPDKIHLLWASQGGVLSSTTCPIGESQLTRMALAFQSALQFPGNIAAVKQQGKALYDCLIKPLEEKGEWSKNKIQNLVIAPDRAVNYIPIAALYDGQQFLIERYTVSNILNAGLTSMDGKLPQNPSVLGIGVSEPLDSFSALPDVKQELRSIVRSQQSPQGIYAGSLYLDQASIPSVFEDNVGKYQIIHIATHGEFNPTTPNQSYLLFSSGQKGKGVRYTLSQIQQQEDLRKVYLVVLSACQTGKGESALSGIEIQGMSAAFVRDRAKAVIASLWNVNDTSTSLLMQQFYKNLATGKMSKAEALRQAQLSLQGKQITAKNTSINREAGIEVVATGGRSLPAPTDFSHPYYWAPFILIGNGL
jgi:CHAT domain-containing protein